MCGIYCSLSRHQHIPPSGAVKSLLHTRGPDDANQICTPDERNSSYITLYSTVLSLRGSVTVSQPYSHSTTTCSLCWNGEAWSVAGEQPNGNDTKLVFEILEKATSEPIQPLDSLEELSFCAKRISQAMSQVAGPYAFVFHDPANCRLYFGRDFLGRRSLLRRVTEDGDVILTSITDGAVEGSWSEVEADGVYCIDLSDKSYGRNLPEGALRRWGGFFVANAPHTVRDTSCNSTKSVGP